jgi:hypothetical protein
MTQFAVAADPSCHTTAGRDASHLAAAEHDTSRLDPGDASSEALRDASRVAAADARRICAWCSGPIPATARRDAVCCSVRCRQARHRFNRAVGRPLADSYRPVGALARLGLVTADPPRPGPAAGPLRLAYADPPYPGNAWMYRGHPDHAGEVDHVDLIRRLSTYDGWALSTSAAALAAVLALCPPGVRIGAWHRGERPARSRWPLNAWEPVIYYCGRPADPSLPDALQSRRVDSLVHGVSPLTTLPGRVTGTKPAAFCRWVFDLLGAAPGDTLDDLFPGSGVVTRAWDAYISDPSRSDRPDASHAARASCDASPGGLRDVSDGSAFDASPEVGEASHAVPGDTRRLSSRASESRALAPAIAARLAVLEAERLTPVPRTSHVAAVDVDDLALVSAYAAGVAAAGRSGHRTEPMSADTAAAWQRLDAVARGHASAGGRHRQ